MAYTIPVKLAQAAGAYRLDPAGMAGNESFDMMDGWCPCMMGFGFGGGFMGILWFILMLAVIIAVVYAVVGLIRGLGQSSQPIQPVQPAPTSREAALERELSELRRELAELKKLLDKDGQGKESR